MSTDNCTEDTEMPIKRGDADGGENEKHPVNEGYLKSCIVKEEYYNPEGLSVTFCVLTLANGYTLTADSYCPDPDEFNKEQGRLVAKQKAMVKLWNLENYAKKTLESCGLV